MSCKNHNFNIDSHEENFYIHSQLLFEKLELNL